MKQVVLGFGILIFALPHSFQVARFQSFGRDLRLKYGLPFSACFFLHWVIIS